MNAGVLRRWLGALRLDEIRCCACKQPFSPAAARTDDDPDLPLCADCGPLLAPYAGPRCPCCGFPYPGLAAGHDESAAPPCGTCLNARPPWRALAYHGLYKGELRDLILRFKFDGELALARLMGAWLENAARCLPAPDALVAMPQHPAHLFRRGFNQAHELARALHAGTLIPLRTDLLFRKCERAPQASLTARQRPGNVRGVFGAGAFVAGLRLWLIDDVMTTGSTLKEATQTLLEAGAAEVCAVAVARTPRTAV